MISFSSCRPSGDALLEQASGAGIHRAMVPFVQYVLLYGLKTLCGIESINALPNLLFSDEALMQLVGFNAQQVRHGVCQRGTNKRQGERAPGPLCPDTLAKNIVKWNLRDLELVCNGALRAWRRRASSATGHRHCGWHRSGATEHYLGVASHPHGAHRRYAWKVHKVEVTVYGWKVLL